MAIAAPSCYGWIRRRRAAWHALPQTVIDKLESFTPRPEAAYLLLVVAAFVWAGSIVLTRGLNEFVPPIGLSFWRWTVATIFLLPFAWREVKRQTSKIRPHLGLFVGLGIIQVGSSTIMVFALDFTTAINATLVNATMPVGTAIVAWLLIRERSSVAQIIGIAVGVLGVAVMLARGDFQVVAGLSFNGGDLLAVLAVLGWATYAVRYRGTPNTIGSLTILFITFVVGSLSLLPFYVAETLFFEPVPLTIFTATSFIFLGVFSSVIGIYIWNVSIKSVGPARSAIFLNLIPVFGAALAIAFLGERLFFFHVAGAGMVAIGIYLVTRTRAEKRAIADT